MVRDEDVKAMLADVLKTAAGALMKTAAGALMKDLGQDNARLQAQLDDANHALEDARRELAALEGPCAREANK